MTCYDKLTLEKSGYVNILSDQREASIFSLAKHINSGVNLRTDTADFSD